MEWFGRLLMYLLCLPIKIVGYFERSLPRGAVIKAGLLYYFKTGLPHYKSSLPEVLKLLSYLNIKKPYSFTYISSDGDLVPSLTLRENILLESTLGHKGVGASSTDEYLKDNCNPHLVELISHVRLLDLYPSKVDLTTRKLVAIIKGLMSSRDLIFFERPEFNLDRKLIDVVKKAALFTQKQLLKTTVVCSQDDLCWEPFSHMIIKKNEEGFKISKGPLNRIEDRFLSIVDIKHDEKELHDKLSVLEKEAA